MVYIDEPIHYKRDGRIPYCHMFTDGNINELHSIAVRLGVKRCWFHNPAPGDHPHYDLSPFYREKAINAGPERIRFMSGKDWVRMIRAKRKPTQEKLL